MIATLSALAVVVVASRIRVAVVNRAARNRLRPRRRGFDVVADLCDRIGLRRASKAQLATTLVLAEVLDHTARRCRSGEALPAALSAVLSDSPAGPSFRAVSRALDRGSTLTEALDDQRNDDANVAYAMHVVRVCSVQGGNVSEPLDRAAATLRERQGLAQDRRTQSAQARLSAQVMTILPLMFGGWVAVTTPTVRQFVVSPPGAACLGLGLLLNVAGWQLMSRAIGEPT